MTEPKIKLVMKVCSKECQHDKKCLECKGDGWCLNCIEYGDEEGHPLKMCKNWLFINNYSYEEDESDYIELCVKDYKY